MKKPVGFVCGGPHDPTIVSAMALGGGGTVHPVTDPGFKSERPAVFWGLLRGSWEGMEFCLKIGRDALYIDHGYFKRGHYDGFYRCSWDGFQGALTPTAPSDDRWRALGLELKPWRKGGRNIIVCPPSPTVAKLFARESWLERTLERIKAHTDRPIIVRNKQDAAARPLGLDLEDAHCLVAFNSIAAVEAVIAGVPVIVDGHSAARPMAGYLAEIEHPVYPEREPWAHALAYSQFTLAEMRSGLAWRTAWEAKEHG